MNRWVKTALVVLIGLVAVGLRWPFGDDTAGPQTYTSDEYGFTVTYDGSLSELALDERENETMMVTDFEVGFFDADGPAIDEEYAADGMMIAVLEIGDPVPEGDPRLDHLGDFTATSVESMGSTDIGEVRDVEIEGCAAAVEVESTDPWGRHVLERVGVAGGRLYMLVAAATSETRDEVWPVLVDALDSFVVTETAGAAPPKIYADPGETFSITCDRRFAYTPVAEEVSGLSQPLGLSDPLSGVDADGLLVDGMVVAVQELDVTFTRAERSSFAKEVAGTLDDDGWRRVSGPEATTIGGLPAYRFEAVLPDGSGDAFYSVFSGTVIYYVEGYAQATTWEQIEPLFDEAARSFEVR